MPAVVVSRNWAVVGVGRTDSDGDGSRLCPLCCRCSNLLSIPGPPYEITYFNNTNITSCSSLPAPVNNCSISRNSTGAIVGGQKTLFCSATRPSNFSHNFPPEMQGNYIISTTFSTPFAFFVDVQTMCCDLPVTEHVVRMNSCGSQ